MREENCFECDPDRNPECTKEICYRKEIGKRFGFVGNPCRLTRKPEAARLDEHGEPVRISDPLSYYLGKKIGADEIQQTVHGLERILEVGIVNAREDLTVIESAIKWLQVLKGLW